jgi:hypothetical protein
MSADEVEERCVQYWRLSKLDDLEMLYHEAKYSLSPFLQLFKILKDKRITRDKDIYDLIKYANHDLPYLTDKIQRLTNDVVNLEYKKKDSKAVLTLWNAQLSDLGQSVTQYQNVIDSKKQQLMKMDKQISQLQGIIRDTKSSKDYAKLRTIMEQNVSSILNDKKAMLFAALLALLESLKNDAVSAHILLSRENMPPDNNQGNYLQLVQQKVLELADHYYDNILQSCINNTLPARS